jgi:hypothetical protein
MHLGDGVRYALKHTSSQGGTLPEESATAVFETETLTALRFSEQALDLFGSHYHLFQFHELPLGEYAPPAEGWHAVTKPMEKLLDLVDAKANPFRNTDDRQVLQDAGCITTLSPDPCGVREQTNPFVVAHCGGPQAGSASYLANRHAFHGGSLPLT